MELTMTNLENCFAEAKREEWAYIGVKIQMQGFEQPEVIINPFNNFDAKLDYYKKAYNDDLTLKTFNGIKIIGFTFGDDFGDIEADLVFGEESAKI